jgi:hypothetical protein
MHPFRLKRSGLIWVREYAGLMVGIDFRIEESGATEPRKQQ